MPAPDHALLSLGKVLQDEGYQFTTVTPLSHRRVLARQRASHALQDVFGWSRPFRRRDVPDMVWRYLDEAGALRTAGDQLRSTVRFSTLDGQIFVHSAFPTDEADAVFFGPDTYRFARLVRQTLQTIGHCDGPLRLLDVGAGSGAGGLNAASVLPGQMHVVLGDINRQALRYCRINAALNAVSTVECVESDLFEDVTGSFDLIIANPPYLVDARARTYRHGGGQFGEGLSLRIATEGVGRLAPGGRLILYTGTAIVAGVDHLQAALQAMLADRSVRLSYEEIDPDVFGEELEHAPYDRADRIAVVGATITRAGDRR
jgi:methylase of polypeptide subunit release factors